MEIVLCKNCWMRIRDVCSHAACIGARAQGFCSPECQQASLKERLNATH